MDRDSEKPKRRFCNKREVGTTGAVLLVLCAGVGALLVDLNIPFQFDVHRHAQSFFEKNDCSWSTCVPFMVLYTSISLVLLCKGVLVCGELSPGEPGTPYHARTRMFRVLCASCTMTTLWIACRFFYHQSSWFPFAGTLLRVFSGYLLLLVYLLFSDLWWLYSKLLTYHEHVELRCWFGNLTFAGTMMMTSFAGIVVFMLLQRMGVKEANPVVPFGVDIFCQTFLNVGILTNQLRAAPILSRAMPVTLATRIVSVLIFLVVLLQICYTYGIIATRIVPYPEIMLLACLGCEVCSSIFIIIISFVVKDPKMDNISESSLRSSGSFDVQRPLMSARHTADNIPGSFSLDLPHGTGTRGSSV